MIAEIAAVLVWGAVAGYFHYSLMKLTSILAIVTSIGLWHHRDLMAKAQHDAYGTVKPPAWGLVAVWAAVFLCALLIALAAAAFPYFLGATVHHNPN